jgi:hypothetical protein
MSVTKEIINAGLTGFYPVIVLSDEIDSVIVDGYDYSELRLNEGMTDQEIMNFAGVI